MRRPLTRTALALLVLSFSFAAPVMMVVTLKLIACIDESLPDGEMIMSMEMKGEPVLQVPPGRPPASMKIEMIAGSDKVRRSGG